MTTPFLVLGTLKLICWGPFAAVRNLVVKRVEKDLNKGVGVVTLQFIFAGLPTAVLSDVGTALRIIEELIGWSSKVLLSVCVVAVRPVVDGRITNRAEGSLVAVKHEFVV